MLQGPSQHHFSSQAEADFGAQKFLLDRGLQGPWLWPGEARGNPRCFQDVKLRGKGEEKAEPTANRHGQTDRGCGS